MKLMTLLVVATLSGSWAHAESLGEVARRERERRDSNREQGVKPVRVITQDDVKTKDSDGASSAPRAVEPSDAPRPATVGPDSSDREREQQNAKAAEWRARAAAARARVDAARQKLAQTPETKTELEWSYGQQFVRVVPNPDYAAAQAEVAAAEKALGDLEDEARRAGALPGWLR